MFLAELSEEAGLVKKADMGDGRHSRTMITISRLLLRINKLHQGPLLDLLHAMVDASSTDSRDELDLELDAQEVKN